MPSSAFKFSKMSIPIPKFSFHILLTSLILLIIIPPHLTDIVGKVLTMVLFNLVMLASLYVVAQQKRTFYIGILLAIPTVLVGWGDFYSSAHLANYLRALTLIAFFGFVSFHLFKYLIKQLHPNTEMIIAAISLYFIIALLWAMIYVSLEIHYPGSFNLKAGIDGGDLTGLINELTYFSFVTISTLGYGDISPQTTFTQGWVVLEAIVGQFYIAIVLARLLGLFVAEETAKEAEKNHVKEMLKKAQSTHKDDGTHH
ncbi:hypothetical protein DU002_02345 [Corallincola holothuriorum]|uniref:Potassium channel domain-containing protein n=1 Tax=Corallincola holothuriorum TaxID=2282215 RepID=A0A368NSA7_9GAMM|nr:potassium channel family protein [Corallincola holothuriorum]RCU52823.1 hypothetical protein DU002_02345 [Corallincola holothuriorum]